VGGKVLGFFLGGARKTKFLKLGEPHVRGKAEIQPSLGWDTEPDGG